MAPPFLTPSQIVQHPTRRAVLRLLHAAGGQASVVEACATLGVRCRSSMHEHARLLARGDYVRVEKTGRGRARQALIMITDRGKAAILNLSTVALE